MDRKHDNRCKLSDKDIGKIRHYRACGMTYKELSEMFHVCMQTVRRMCDETVAERVKVAVRATTNKILNAVRTPEEQAERRKRLAKNMRNYRLHLRELKCKKKK